MPVVPSQQLNMNIYHLVPFDFLYNMYQFGLVRRMHIGSHPARFDLPRWLVQGCLDVGSSPLSSLRMTLAY